MIQKLSIYRQRWRLGWQMIGKTLLAYLVLSLCFLPLVILGAIPSVEEFLHHDTPSSIGVRLALLFLLLVVYFPLSFYVAASSVGFCPRVDKPLIKNDSCA